ncbi:hypothetical protein KC361_g220 [Hortaea werneckii]|nr:hypothetical protein KC361_g220 [Hortaea werneckii]
MKNFVPSRRYLASLAFPLEAIGSPTHERRSSVPDRRNLLRASSAPHRTIAAEFQHHIRDGLHRCNNLSKPDPNSVPTHFSGPVALTISNAPRITPQRILLYHSSSCARPSSGNSTNSASGFSSKTNVNACGLPPWPWAFSSPAGGPCQFLISGVTFRNILNPTLLIISATSRKLAQCPVLLLARNSSINRRPTLYPMRSSSALTAR